MVVYLLDGACGGRRLLTFTLTPPLTESDQIALCVSHRWGCLSSHPRIPTRFVKERKKERQSLSVGFDYSMGTILVFSSALSMKLTRSWLTSNHRDMMQLFVSYCNSFPINKTRLVLFRLQLGHEEYTLKHPSVAMNNNST